VNSFVFLSRVETFVNYLCVTFDDNAELSGTYLNRLIKEWFLAYKGMLRIIVFMVRS
jgi:hypothetical protein